MNRSQISSLNFEEEDSSARGNTSKDTIGGREVIRSTGTRASSDEKYLLELEQDRVAKGSGMTNLKSTHHKAKEALEKAGLGEGAEERFLARETRGSPVGVSRPEPKWVPEKTNFNSIDSPFLDMEMPVEWSEDLIRPPQPNQIRLDGLVSSGHPYGGRNYLMIRPLQWDEVEILAQASEQDSVPLVMRAVDRCIDIPVEVLAIPDFYQLLYWLRTQSYPELPFLMPWTCDEPVEGKGPDVMCGHDNQSPLGRSNLMLTELDDLGFTGQLHEALDWPRVYMLPELQAIQRRDQYRIALETSEALLRTSDLNQDQRRQANTEYLLIQNRMRKSEGYLNNVCKTPDILTPDLTQTLRWVKAGRTFAQKRDALRQQGDLSLYQTIAQLERQYDYGVHESVRVNCGKCGASRGFNLIVDVTTFLS